MKFLVLSTAVFLALSCSPKKNQYTRMEGKVFGTYYSITYKSGEDYRTEIEDLLHEYAQGVSKYDSTSEVSDFNKNGTLRFRSPYLKALFNQKKELYEVSDEALDPTLMPLIEAFGLGTAKPTNLDSAEVDSLLQLVNFNSIVLKDSKLENSKRGVTLDLNAIGEEYGIDLVGDGLKRQGIIDFKVEIGGKVLCSGLNADSK